MCARFYIRFRNHSVLFRWWCVFLSLFLVLRANVVFFCEYVLGAILCSPPHRHTNNYHIIYTPRVRLSVNMCIFTYNIYSIKNVCLAFSIPGLSCAALFQLYDPQARTRCEHDDPLYMWKWTPPSNRPRPRGGGFTKRQHKPQARAFVYAALSGVRVNRFKLWTCVCFWVCLRIIEYASYSSPPSTLLSTVSSSRHPFNMLSSQQICVCLCAI